MRRTILLFVLVPVMLAFAAQPAAAGWGPPVPYEGHEASAEWCGFPVEIDAWGRTIDHEWYDADGNYHYVAIAGGTWVTATNPATETSITLPYNGALLYWQTPDDSVWTQTATGGWIWTADPATFLEVPGLFYSTGRISWSGWDPLTYSQSGRLIDLCPLLAS